MTELSITVTRLASEIDFSSNRSLSIRSQHSSTEIEMTCLLAMRLRQSSWLKLSIRNVTVQT